MPKTPIRYGNEDKVTTRLYPGDKARLKEKAEANTKVIGELLREIVSSYLAEPSKLEYDAGVIAETIGMDYEDFVSEALIEKISRELGIETSEYLKGLFI